MSWFPIVSCHRPRFQSLLQAPLNAASRRIKISPDFSKQSAPYDAPRTASAIRTRLHKPLEPRSLSCGFRSGLRKWSRTVRNPEMAHRFSLHQIGHILAALLRHWEIYIACVCVPLQVATAARPASLAEGCFQRLPKLPWRLSGVPHCTRWPGQSPTADEFSDASASASRESEKSMVRNCVLAAKDAAILDWVFFAMVVLALGLGVSCATPHIKPDCLETSSSVPRNP